MHFTKHNAVTPLAFVERAHGSYSMTCCDKSVITPSSILKINTKRRIKGKEEGEKKKVEWQTGYRRAQRLLKGQVIERTTRGMKTTEETHHSEAFK